LRIVEVRQTTVPIASTLKNAYIDFSKMDVSVVAVVTDIERDGRRVVGYGFNSNGRYGARGLLQDRFIPRLMAADPRSLLTDDGENLDPHRIWVTLMTGEKPGGHGERSVAVGVIDMAVWDVVAKIEGKPLYRVLADRYRNGEADDRVWVYAGTALAWRSMPTAASIWRPLLPTPTRWRRMASAGMRRRETPSTTRCKRGWAKSIPIPWRRVRTSSRSRTRAI
jgi:L-alanine-DL-glutamate epimerase-like enolase superfamily enzyme